MQSTKHSGRRFGTKFLLIKVLIQGYKLSLIFSPARIACLDFNLQKTKMQLGAQVLVTDPCELEKIRQREADMTT
ncbi:putative groEL-like apical domain superfamily protein [Helianthus debilis subsp. tardiflorus]